jgi:hypothetical protein
MCLDKEASSQQDVTWYKALVFWSQNYVNTAILISTLCQHYSSDLNTILTLLFSDLNSTGCSGEKRLVLHIPSSSWAGKRLIIIGIDTYMLVAAQTTLVTRDWVIVHSVFTTAKKWQAPYIARWHLTITSYHCTLSCGSVLYTLPQLHVYHMHTISL